MTPAPASRLTRRTPTGPLAGLVASLWDAEDDTTGTGSAPHPAFEERLLPGTAMQLVVRTCGAPVRVWTPGSHGHAVSTLPGALVSGPRPVALQRRLGGPGCVTGALLRPGATARLFGAGADALAGRHTPLDALWGPAAQTLVVQLAEAAEAQARLSRLEAFLTARLTGSGRAVPPAPAGSHLVVALANVPSVALAARHCGLGPRQFNRLFQQACGLPPRTWLQLRRFEQAVKALHAGGPSSLASLALDLGFSDQPHLQREFRRLAGLTPDGYRRQPPPAAFHLPRPPGPAPCPNPSRTDALPGAHWPLFPDGTPP